MNPDLPKGEEVENIHIYEFRRPGDHNHISGVRSMALRPRFSPGLPFRFFLTIFSIVQFAGRAVYGFANCQVECSPLTKT